MKILITNVHLNRPAGSEMWTSTIANELQRIGHNVCVFTLELGKFAQDKFYAREMSNIPLKTAKELIGDYFDLAILGHPISILPHLKETAWGKVIILCHGISPLPEKPIDIFNAKYFCVSEEIRQYYKGEFNFHVLKQPISQKWFDIPECGAELKKILWAQHRTPAPDYNRLEKVLGKKRDVILDKIALPTDTINQGLIWPEAVRNRYAEAQLIIGGGRWVYQAMAAGRPTIIAKNNETLGMLTPTNYESFACCNMTNRHPSACKPNWDLLLNKWSIDLGYQLREIALQHHHVSMVIKIMLEHII